jgi:hypothetical protein
MVAVLVIPVIAYALKLLPEELLGVAWNITISVILLGLTALCCYSLWRRHIEKI